MHSMGLSVLPKSIDWRTKGAVTDVKEQGECGSCWAFSTVGALEGAQFRKTGRLVSLSVQNLIDCSDPKLRIREKCHGRQLHRAFEFIKENGGIDTDRSYPYKGIGGICKYNPKNAGAKLRDVKDISEGDELKLQQAIATIGPISISVDSSRESFQHYSGGIYYDRKCSSNVYDLDHSMVVIGYGTDKNGKDYYIIKNSYGTDWGEKGYMRLARNRNNHCGIANDAMYPVV